MKRPSNTLTHLNQRNQPSMVDIGHKPATRRTAEARAELVVTREIAALMRDGELHAAKGPVFHTAIIAGTQAVKDTSRLIPFCHPLPLDRCTIDIDLNDLVITIVCRVSAFYKTGVEMEALTGATVAALTIYDMCKAVTHDMEIRSVRLVAKAGGKRTVKRPS
jgi:cyclic pyranopterin phosphate synthase